MKFSTWRKSNQQRIVTVRREYATVALPLLYDPAPLFTLDDFYVVGVKWNGRGLLFYELVRAGDPSGMDMARRIGAFRTNFYSGIR